MPLAVFPKGFFNDLVTRRMPLSTWLELAASLDVDGVEMYPAFLESFDEPYLHPLAARISSLGLEMPMLCHSPDFTHPDAAAREREVETALRMIGVTRALGGRFCRVLSGQRHPGVGEEEGIGRVVDSIARLLPAAEDAGVVLTLENHYKDGTWEYPEFAQGRERFLRILRELPSPWLRVQFDPSNAVVAGIDPYDLLDEVADRVATMHASDRYLEGGGIDDLRALDADPLHGYARLLRHGVIGEGFNDFDRIFARLAAAGFRGWVSIEDGEGDTVEQGMENLRRSVQFLRRYAI
jgi:sugar phosphate isomerase/epimerase